MDKKRIDDFVCASKCGEGEGRRLEGSTILSALPTKTMVLPSRVLLLAYMRLHVPNHVHCLCHTAAQASALLLLVVGGLCVTTSIIIKTVVADCGRETNV
jgi:hypothetical protein